MKDLAAIPDVEKPQQYGPYDVVTLQLAVKWWWGAKGV